MALELVFGGSSGKFGYMISGYYSLFLSLWTGQLNLVYA